MSLLLFCTNEKDAPKLPKVYFPCGRQGEPRWSPIEIIRNPHGGSKRLLHGNLKEPFKEDFEELLSGLGGREGRPYQAQVGMASTAIKRIRKTQSRKALRKLTGGPIKAP